MKDQRFPGVLAVALVAMAGTTPLFTQQADKPDPEQLAVVQRIRARIEERAAKTPGGPPKAYTVTIPNTTFSYTMAPVPAGEFLMGSDAAGASRRATAAQGACRRLLDADPRSDVGLVLDVHVRRPGEGARPA